MRRLKAATVALADKAPPGNPAAHPNGVEPPLTQYAFDVLTVLGWALNENATPPAQRSGQLDLDKLTPELVEGVTQWVFDEFAAAAASDQVAKDDGFTARLKLRRTVKVTKPYLVPARAPA